MLDFWWTVYNTLKCLNQSCLTDLSYCDFIYIHVVILFVFFGVENKLHNTNAIWQNMLENNDYGTRKQMYRGIKYIRKIKVKLKLIYQRYFLWSGLFLAQNINLSKLTTIYIWPIHYIIALKCYETFLWCSAISCSSSLLKCVIILWNFRFNCKAHLK